jgi:hypothetical protein
LYILETIQKECVKTPVTYFHLSAPKVFLMLADSNENDRFPSSNLEQGKNDQLIFPFSKFTFPCSQLVFYLPPTRSDVSL